ncbi:MAG TPA: hypothetical protein VNG90_04225 [Candidatus Acidoferrum sp.]|nr:hypothetical protein [Candidatus Acidoferrum sp.]
MPVNIHLCSLEGEPTIELAALKMIAEVESHPDAIVRGFFNGIELVASSGDTAAALVRHFILMSLLKNLYHRK